MSGNNEILNEIQLDALGELLNIGMGAAAASLSTMVQQEVLLTVPVIQTLSQNEVAIKLDDNPPKTVCGVRQSFRGDFTGDALLLFSEEKSLSLVSAVLGETMPLDELGEMEEEAITEIGNIILNACIGSLANIFSEHLASEIPQYLHEELDELFKDDVADDRCALLLRMSFSIAEEDITGFVTFIMNVDSVSRIKTQLDKMLGL